MPRLPRIIPPGIPQHLVQRGNNRNVCFASDVDKAHYINYLKRYSCKHQVQVHAWVLMTNHVHLLVTPSTSEGLSCMMQELGRQYVTFFNQAYSRTGTLWEGRFKSCLVGSDTHLLQCYRYIELNPVRAGMVNHPGEYIWSSYQCNALGKHSSLTCHHPQYLALGLTRNERLANYSALVRQNPGNNELNDIRDALNKGMALGNEKFKDEMEMLLSRRVRPATPGRPPNPISK
jgi:putative transposase